MLLASKIISSVVAVITFAFTVKVWCDMDDETPKRIRRLAEMYFTFVFFLSAFCLCSTWMK